MKSLFSIACLFVMVVTYSATVTWTGEAGDGLWFTAGNWDTGAVPDASDDVIINSGDVSYIPGGDWSPSGTVFIGKNASWTQTGGAWPNITGTIIIEGSMDFDTAGQIRFNNGASLVLEKGASLSGTGSLNINSGSSITFNDEITVSVGNLTMASDSSLKLYGGSLNDTGSYSLKANDIYGGGTYSVANELQWSTEVEISGTVFTCGILASQNTAGILNLSAGGIITTGTNHGSYWQGGSSFINFTPKSTGFVVLAGATLDNIYSSYFAGATPKFRYNGHPIGSQEDFNATFDVAEYENGGVIVSLKQAEESEPVFVDNACYASDIAATSATISTAFETLGSGDTVVNAVYGTTNGGTVIDAWENSVGMNATEGLAFNASLSELVPNTIYFYRAVASNQNHTKFASPTPAYFYTGSVLVDTIEKTIPELGGETEIVFSLASGEATTSDIVVPFVIEYTAGTEANIGYELSSNTAPVIKAGSTSTSVSICSIPNWSVAEGVELTISVVPNNNFINDGASAMLTIQNSELPSAPINVWLGAVSTDSTDPNNWSQGAPKPTDIIYFSEATAQKDLYWNEGTSLEVAGWVQIGETTADYPSVCFVTTPDAPLVINGDVVMEGGYWFSDGPSDNPTKALAVTVRGNMNVAESAVITVGNGVNGTRNYARGYFKAGPGFLINNGSCHAGEGGMTNLAEAVTYGSILNPLSYGSSGRGDIADARQFAGGGVIVLKVDGELTLNGRISSMGFGWPFTRENIPEYASSAGGSINLTCGNLVGAGSICANGGGEGTGEFIADRGSGSGGRIKVAVTNGSLAEFTGAISAYGRYGNIETAMPYSASGTVVYYENGAPARVVVDNDGRVDGAPIAATHLPAMDCTEQAALANSSWEIINNGAVRLTRNIRVTRMKLVGENARLLLNGKTLKVESLQIDDVTFNPGIYASTDLPTNVEGEGNVEVMISSTLIILK